ncbi:Rossmann-like and DUF2520 domain-containing protein [Halpernia frigidisoli]|uniref:Predicted oxidoreductase, contains short-chain dehydrogenase (SDR) and DUF2520 domains n=1 Tax=Halpernia frigidisoli TaxID=1125876 RepID=A0A1I3H280_9FLAO|nr:Rossmann-like and DUF2520 domain-containing protein [Halpernia frigidisoli]SFI29834.1 Predicted oxidoreductase, contains short-chain dehydrogenase (SDR) and DUF2520 domains [Halpernia frigidisoli]
MKIVIIGSGNVAYHLTKAFCQNKIAISQIFGRNEKDLKEISREFNVPFSTENLEKADLYIIAVKDESVEEVSRQITVKDCLVAHTSGSLEKEKLDGKYRKASFYPLQTFSKTKDLDYKKIPFFIEAENNQDFEILNNLAQKISTKVLESNFEQRKFIHLTAVFACNFTNHLFAKAKEISDSQNIPFDYFLPLIDETVEKIHHISPKEAQTGPAIREDEKVLRSHEILLADKDAKSIFDVMNISIKSMYKK